MSVERSADWAIDAARVRAIAAAIAGAAVEREDDVVRLANEAQVDILQIKWRREGPDEEWSALYRLVNDAHMQFHRRWRRWNAARVVDVLAADGRAALARCAEAMR